MTSLYRDQMEKYQGMWSIYSCTVGVFTINVTIKILQKNTNIQWFTRIIAFKNCHWTAFEKKSMDYIKKGQVQENSERF